MSFHRTSRRRFLQAAGATAAAGAATLTGIPGVFDFPSQALAATNLQTASLQTNLSNFVDLRFGMFNHFNMGTFTNEEWATPNLNPLTFAPTAVDCAQWAAAAVSAKMKFGILTTKHHDGFCLWPTAYNKYNVAYSSYPHDIVKMYTDAFRAAGLKVGLYFSIWDRTYPVQANDTRHNVTGTITPPDIAYVLNQITELLTNYGQIDIFVNDGYAWQMGQQAIPYQQVREHVKALRPDVIMIGHGGLSQPFLGDAIYFEEPLGITSPAGNTYAASQGQTISNGWFWHPATPTTDPMSLSSIVSHLQDLEPKYTSFILNCPPNRDGVLDTNIVNRLGEVGGAWSPNLSRAPLPTQQFRTEHPVTPVTATATFFHTGEPATNAIDGLSDKNFETCWSTWSQFTFPQAITVDLGTVYTNISTLEYLPKQWNRTNTTDGDITSYTIFLSTDGSTFTQVASGTWAGNQTTKLAEWPATNARYLKLQANAGTGNYANVSELRIGGRLAIPVAVPTSNVTYQLVNVRSGKVLDVSGASLSNGGSVIQNTNQGGTNQMWRLVDVGSGYFELVNVKSGLALEVPNAAINQGIQLDQSAYTGGTHQQWKFVLNSNGYYTIVNRNSGLLADVSGGSTADAAAVIQWPSDGGTNQQWQLVLFP